MRLVKPEELATSQDVTELVKPSLETDQPLRELTIGEITLVDALCHSSGEHAIYPKDRMLRLIPVER